MLLEYQFKQQSSGVQTGTQAPGAYIFINTKHRGCPYFDRVLLIVQ